MSQILAPYWTQEKRLKLSFFHCTGCFHIAYSWHVWSCWTGDVSNFAWLEGIWVLLRPPSGRGGVADPRLGRGLVSALPGMNIHLCLPLTVNQLNLTWRKKSLYRWQTVVFWSLKKSCSPPAGRSLPATVARTALPACALCTLCSLCSLCVAATTCYSLSLCLATRPTYLLRVSNHNVNSC